MVEIRNRELAIVYFGTLYHSAVIIAPNAPYDHKQHQILAESNCNKYLLLETRFAGDKHVQQTGVIGQVARVDDVEFNIR